MDPQVAALVTDLGKSPSHTVTISYICARRALIQLNHAVPHKSCLIQVTDLRKSPSHRDDKPQTHRTKIIVIWVDQYLISNNHNDVKFGQNQIGAGD